MTSIGFIGLGSMGTPLAGRLLDAGYELHGHNRTRDKASKLIERGLIWHDTPRELAAACDVTFSMVSDDAALDAVCAGPDGLISGLSEGKVHVDMSTVSPDLSVEIAGRVRETGAAMVDAPVSGSVPQAESGELTIMVGGDDWAFARVEPLLAELGSKVVHVGANGKGLVLKLAINISLASQLIAFSEGLVLAERAGIDPELAGEVMGGSPIGSAMLKARVPLMLELPAEAWFSVGLLRKDVLLAIAAGEASGVELPSARLADALLGAAERLGYMHRDVAAVHEVLDLHAGALAELHDHGKPTPRG